MVSRKAPASKDVVYQIKITLCPRDIRPPIWRRILIPASATLESLHRAIQISVGWLDYHLHLFKYGERVYSHPEAEIEGAREESRVRIEQVLKRPGAKMRYEYDFGDGWTHDVELEKVLLRDPETFYPVCVAGKRACPPEDCGSIPGYYRLCEAMADPNHPDREDLLEWLGGTPYDPEAFSLTEVNVMLKGEE